MSIRKKAGRISPVLMGVYDNTTTYRRLDWVYYGGTSYICKKNDTLGVVPSNTERWQKIIESPTEISMSFDMATTRTNIVSGEKLSVILGKIAKFFTDLKAVAFTGNYDDLSNRPSSLKNPSSLNINFNGTVQASYDGSVQKEVNITPAGINAVNTSTLLNTIEQISANTNADNITGALAAKAMKADYNNKINQINSNLMAVGAEYEIKNGWTWTSGTGITRIGNTVTICLALIGTEIEFNENDKLIQFDVKYAPNTWTQIPALVEAMDGTPKPIFLRVDVENGGIVVAIPFRAYHIMINASWIARL